MVTLPPADLTPVIKPAIPEFPDYKLTVNGFKSDRSENRRRLNGPALGFTHLIAFPSPQRRI